MYQDDGSMRMLDEKEEKAALLKTDAARLFFVGQKLEINGGWFRVQNVNPRGLRLKAIPKPEEVSDGI